MKLTPRDLAIEILQPSEWRYSEAKKKHYKVKKPMPDEQTINAVLKNLESVLSSLDERDVCILRKRYFDGMTIRASGKKIVNLSHNPCDGVTTERARQIICKAIRILRHPARMKKLLATTTLLFLVAGGYSYPPLTGEIRQNNQFEIYDDRTGKFYYGTVRDNKIEIESDIKEDENASPNDGQDGNEGRQE